MRGARIAGIGRYVPETERLNSAWPAEFVGRATAAFGAELTDVGDAHADPVAHIVARHMAVEGDDPFRGARSRRVADLSMSAAEAEAMAAREALDDASMRPEDVDVILSWAMVPDRVTPPSAPRVAHLLGATRAVGVGADAACATGIAQLMLATALVESGRARCVLLTQSHLIARANPMLHPASPIVGDAATAYVVVPAQRRHIVDVHMVSHGEFFDAVTWVRSREGDEPPWWEAGGPYVAGTRDRGLARRLGGRLVHFARDTVEELLARVERRADEIDVLAVTQPRRWFPAAVAESLGVDPSRAPDTWNTLAHVGGCGVFTNLLEARHRGMLRDGSEVVLFAMGAGVTRAAAWITW
jgi:3-oxoacyl-[acyl-carrier-protein] synthase III